MIPTAIGLTTYHPSYNTARLTDAAGNQMVGTPRTVHTTYGSTQCIVTYMFVTL